jgi:hypothetical protein
MGGLDGPLLGIEIVGTGAEILHHSKRITLIAHLHKPERRVGRKLEGLTLQIADGLRVGKAYLRCEVRGVR